MRVRPPVLVHAAYRDLPHLAAWRDVMRALDLQVAAGAVLDALDARPALTDDEVDDRSVRDLDDQLLFRRGGMQRSFGSGAHAAHPASRVLLDPGIDERGREAACFLGEAADRHLTEGAAGRHLARSLHCDLRARLGLQQADNGTLGSDKIVDALIVGYRDLYGRCRHALDGQRVDQSLRGVSASTARSTLAG